MRHRLSLVAIALLIAAALLSACQQQGPAIPNDPVEAVKTFAEKQKDVKSQHLDINLDFTMKMTGLQSTEPAAALFSNFKATASASGDFDSVKQDFTLSGSADLGILTAFVVPDAEEIKFELVKAGDTLYSRLADQAWSTTNVPATSETQNAAELLDFASLLQKTAKAERLDDESVDGTDTYHFKVTLDPVELLNEISKAAGVAGSLSLNELSQAAEYLKNSTVELDLWVGKADLLIRQEKIYFKLDLKDLPNTPPDAAILAEINMTVKASKINQPVTITAPK
ncbi:MAG TPA: hypothetical protein VIK33_06070 [Anaerolineae bacterium]